MAPDICERRALRPTDRRRATRNRRRSFRRIGLLSKWQLRAYRYAQFLERVNHRDRAAACCEPFRMPLSLVVRQVLARLLDFYQPGDSGERDHEVGLSLLPVHGLPIVGDTASVAPLLDDAFRVAVGLEVTRNHFPISHF